MNLQIYPLTPDRWGDFVDLFGRNGACAGCWCMWWRLPRSAWNRQRGAANRTAIRKIAMTGEMPGLLAYANGRAVGWCAIAPREKYPRLERSRVLKPVDDRPVWSLSCFFVARPWRRRGVTIELLKGAVRFARDHGAQIVEGYPIEPAKPQADAFVYPGLASAFRKAGFKEVLRRSPTRPIMRCEL